MLDEQDVQIIDILLVYDEVDDDRVDEVDRDDLVRIVENDDDEYLRLIVGLVQSIIIETCENDDTDDAVMVEIEQHELIVNECDDDDDEHDKEILHHDEHEIIELLLLDIQIHVDNVMIYIRILHDETIAVLIKADISYICFKTHEHIHYVYLIDKKKRTTCPLFLCCNYHIY